MKWQEVRELYPETWVKLKILESHMENDRKYIDDMAVIKTILDDREATKELMKCKDNILVYHTANKEVVFTVRKESSYGLRLRFRNREL